LHDFVVQDLNHEPRLPFADHSFDVVLNTVSVEYLTNPFKVFREVGRVLKPGGLVLITFSDRMFPEKAVAVWRESCERERVMIVEDILAAAQVFTPTRLWVCKGLPRPADDPHADLSSTSDPIYAVVAEREGGGEWSRPFPDPPVESPYSAAEVARRKQEVGSTLRCPHCDSPLTEMEVPQTPYTSWEAESLYVCTDDQCPFLIRGWQTMSQQRMPGSSCRFVFDPGRNRCASLPVNNLKDIGGPSRAG
jgi:hypothetical protein